MTAGLRPRLSFLRGTEMERSTLLFLLLFPWHVVAAQETVATGMPTIEVDFFTRLEKQLMEAVVKQDRSALEPLLTSDFELRTSRTGGELTFRDEWLQEAISTYKVRSFRISGLTVRPVGNSAVVNFFYEQQATFAGRDISGDFFLVDIWQKAGNDWKLLARYSAGPGVTSKPPSNPKTKE
jgi:hypothetical protein